MDIPNTGAIFTLGKSYLADNTQSYFYIKNDPVKRVISGPHQSAVICGAKLIYFITFTESGRLFVWGENHHGQLGIGGNNNQYNNNNNNDSNNNDSNSDSNNNDNNNNNNEGNTNNNAGKTGDIVTKPTCVKSLKTLGLKVTDVAFGNGWAVMLTHSNELFFSGRNIFPDDTEVTQNFNTAIVRDEECAIIRKPFRLEEFDDCLPRSEVEENFLAVLAGNEHFALMTSLGRLIGWGSNASHQLGLADESEELAPLEIVLDAPVKQFTCGPESTLVLTESGNLYLTGHLNDLTFPQFTELQKNLAPNEEIIFMHISKASEIYIVTNAGVIYRSFESLRNKHLIFQRFYDYDSEENGPIWKLLRGFSFYTVLTKANKFYTTFSESGHHLKTFREITKFKNLRLLDMAVGDQHILVHGIPRSSTLSASVGSGGEHRYMSRTFVLGDNNGNVSRGRSGNKSAVLQEKIPEEQESLEKEELMKKEDDLSKVEASKAPETKTETPEMEPEQIVSTEVKTSAKEKTSDGQPAKVTSAKVKSAGVKTPKVKSAEVKTPKLKSAGEKTAGVKPTEEKPLEEKTLEEKSSEEKPEEVKSAKVKTTKLKSAGVNIPKLKSAEVKIPKLKSAGEKTAGKKTAVAKTTEVEPSEEKTLEEQPSEVKPIEEGPQEVESKKVKTSEEQITKVETPPEKETPEEKTPTKTPEKPILPIEKVVDPTQPTTMDSNGNQIAEDTEKNTEEKESNADRPHENTTSENEHGDKNLGNLKLQKQSSIDDTEGFVDRIEEESTNFLAAAKTKIATTLEDAGKAIGENLEKIEEKISAAFKTDSPTKSIQDSPKQTAEATNEKNEDDVPTAPSRQSSTKSIRETSSKSTKESSARTSRPASLKESPTKSIEKSVKDSLSPNRGLREKSPTDSAKSGRSARSIHFTEEALVEKHSASVEKPHRPRTPYPDSSSASASVNTPPTTKKTLRNFSYEAAMEHDAIDNTTPMLHDSMENITENSSSTDDEHENGSAFKSTIKTPTPPYEEDEELRLEIETITDELDQTVINEIRFINNGVDVTPSVEHRMQPIRMDSIEENLEGKLEAVSEEVAKAASETLESADEKLNEKVSDAVDAKNELKQEVKQEVKQSKESLTAMVDTKLQHAKDSMELTAQKVATGARDAVDAVGENAKKAATGARDAVQTVGANAKQAASDTGDAIGALGHKAMDMASDAGHAIGAMGHKAMDAASDAKHAVGNAMTKVADNTKHAMDSMTSKIAHQLSDAKESVSSLVATSSNKNKHSQADNELDLPASEANAKEDPPKPTAGEDDERTTASINSNHTSSGNPFDNNNPFESSNPFDDDMPLHPAPAPSYESAKHVLNDALPPPHEAEVRHKGKMRQFLSDMRTKSKGMSCRSEKSIRIEDEPPRYTPVETPHNSNIDHRHTNGHGNSNTSTVCTIL